jgi:hypothetical protein
MSHKVVPFVTYRKPTLGKNMNESELNQTIHKHRDELATLLEFCPRIEKLVDIDHCEQIQKFIHSHGSKWEKRSAISSLGDSLPNEQGVYMFVWTPKFSFEFDTGIVEPINWIVYVGKAGINDGKNDTIKSRYISEYRHYLGCNPSMLWDSKAIECREQRLKKFLNLWPLSFWYLPLGETTPREIELAERQLIRLFNPPLNVVHTRRLRPNKPEPA